jgi:hypothetical protein
MDVVMVDRKEDMSPDGYLRLTMEQDGDIIITVASGGANGGLEQFADIQFCTTFGGGGASPKTHKALRELMQAMAEDNRDGKEHRRQEFSGAEILKQKAGKG